MRALQHKKMGGDLDDAADGVGDQIKPPDGALTWSNTADRNKALMKWRRAVCRQFGQQPSAIRLAWVLKDLFHVRDGYCFARNAFLADQAALWPRHVQGTLKALEKGRAILRQTILTKGKRIRVIFPASAIIKRTEGGDTRVSPPPHDTRVSRHPGVTRYKNSQRR